MLNDLHMGSLIQLNVQSNKSFTEEETTLVAINLWRWSSLKFPKTICLFKSRKRLPCGKNAAARDIKEILIRKLKKPTAMFWTGINLRLTKASNKDKILQGGVRFFSTAYFCFLLFLINCRN